ILLFGSAFISSKSKSDEIAPLDFIPPTVIEANLAGGGDQGSRPPPSAPPVREVAPSVSKVEPKPEPKPEPVKVREPEPPKDPVKPQKEVVESFEVKKEPKRHTPEITTKVVSRSSDTKKK